MSEVLEIRKLAHEYVQNGELDKALTEYGKLLKKDGVDPNIFNLMGDVYYKKGDVEKAFKQYGEAVRKYRDENLYSNAIAVCRKMLRLKPDYIGATELLGELYLEQNFSGEAAGYFLEYAGKLAERGEMQKAAEQLRRILQSDPANSKAREFLERIEQE